MTDAGLQRHHIDVTTPPPAPDMIHLWLYKGELHFLNAEPGDGKTLFALWLAIQLIDDGYSIMFLDEENGPDIITERLYHLGAEDEAIRERFFYYPFPGRSWGPKDLADLDEAIAEAQAAAPLGLGLVILDSLPDFLAAAGKDENVAKDITEFVRHVCLRFHNEGCAQLVLDHIPKPQDGQGKKKRSRYGRGSSAKLAKPAGAFLLEKPTEFNRKHSGSLAIWCTKDRRGGIELPKLDSPPVEMDVAVNPIHHSITIKVRPRAADDRWDGPTQCMDAVVEILETVGQEMSLRKLYAAVRGSGHVFGDDTIKAAAERLALNGKVARRRGRQGAFLYGALQPDT